MALVWHLNTGCIRFDCKSNFAKCSRHYVVVDQDGELRLGEMRTAHDGQESVMCMFPIQDQPMWQINDQCLHFLRKKQSTSFAMDEIARRVYILNSDVTSGSTKFNRRCIAERSFEITVCDFTSFNDWALELGRTKDRRRLIKGKALPELRYCLPITLLIHPHTGDLFVLFHRCFPSDSFDAAPEMVVAQVIFDQSMSSFSFRLVSSVLLLSQKQIADSQKRWYRPSNDYIMFGFQFYDKEQPFPMFVYSADGKKVIWNYTLIEVGGSDEGKETFVSVSTDLTDGKETYRLVSGAVVNPTRRQLHVVQIGEMNDFQLMEHCETIPGAGTDAAQTCPFVLRALNWKSRLSYNLQRWFDEQTKHLNVKMDFASGDISAIFRVQGDNLVFHYANLERKFGRFTMFLQLGEHLKSLVDQGDYRCESCNDVVHQTPQWCAVCRRLDAERYLSSHPEALLHGFTTTFCSQSCQRSSWKSHKPLHAIIKADGDHKPRSLDEWKLKKREEPEPQTLPEAIVPPPPKVPEVENGKIHPSKRTKSAAKRLRKRMKQKEKEESLLKDPEIDALERRLQDLKTVRRDSCDTLAENEDTRDINCLEKRLRDLF